MERPKLWGSCRLSLAIFCFFGSVNIFFMRFNFSMAIVCMTGTVVNSTESDQAIEGEFEDWDRSVVSNLLAAFFYGYCATQLLGGHLSDRFGGKLVLAFGMFGLSLTSMLIPVLTRIHWGFLMALRIAQGLLSGFTIPAIYNMFTVWSSPEEKATLMAITFAGISVANIMNYPLSSLLCYSQVDHGWPLIFYLPGITSFLWLVLFYLMTSNKPEDHPRISEEEKLYLMDNSCRSKSKLVSDHKAKLKIPWKAMALSVPVHALGIAHISSAWLFYFIALNLPLIINETFNLGIVYNGLLCAIPYILVFIFNFSGKLFDVLLSTDRWSANTLRKFFNTIGLIVPSILFCLMPFFKDSLTKIVALSICAAFKTLATSAGFFTSHADLAGPFAGLVFGYTNTLAQIPGFVNPLLIDALAPDGTTEQWQTIFYVTAGVATFGALVYLFLGSSTLQPWAGGDDSKENQYPDDLRQDEGQPNYSFRRFSEIA